jgi:hypothetical protein
MIMKNESRRICKESIMTCFKVGPLSKHLSRDNEVNCEEVSLAGIRTDNQIRDIKYMNQAYEELNRYVQFLLTDQSVI